MKGLSLGPAPEPTTPPLRESGRHGCGVCQACGTVWRQHSRQHAPMPGPSREGACPSPPSSPPQLRTSRSPSCPSEGAPASAAGNSGPPHRAASCRRTCGAVCGWSPRACRGLLPAALGSVQSAVLEGGDHVAGQVVVEVAGIPRRVAHPDRVAVAVVAGASQFVGRGNQFPVLFVGIVGEVAERVGFLDQVGMIVMVVLRRVQQRIGELARPTTRDDLSLGSLRDTTSGQPLKPEPQASPPGRWTGGRGQ